MTFSTLWETYGLWLLGIPSAILLLIIVFAAARRNRDDLDWELARGREPRLQGGGGRAYAQAYRDDGRRSGGRGSGQSGFRPPGILPRLVWLVVGGAVGVAGGLVWLNPDTVARFEPVVAALARQIEAVVNSVASTEPEPAADTAAAPTTDTPAEPQAPTPAPTQAVSATQPAAAPDEVAAMITAFVTNLKAQLPIAVSPGINMAVAEAEGRTISVGFSVARILPEEDQQILREELEPRFRSSVCSVDPNPSNIRGLNERGVTFQISYVDPVGAVVAAMTVKPGFCAQ